MYMKTKTHAIALTKTTVLSFVQFLTLIGVATVAPFFHNQIITGSFVNATLFISTLSLGTRRATFVALLPSVIAVSIGTLPVVLAPAVPYIMVSNIILIFTFYYLKGKNYWLAAICASVLKFSFLYVSNVFIIRSLVQGEIAAKVSMMLSWPQLVTALIGSMLAFGVYGWFRR